MIRNLKILMLAAMALAAFGVINVGGAQAAGEQFHCEVEPCKFTLKKDGTEETAHHVFVVKNSLGKSISFTCEELSGEGASVKTAKELTLTSLVYSGCQAAGQTVAVRMNGCDYNFRSENGGAGGAGATVTIECTGENKIEIELTGTKCIFTVAGGQDLFGLRYHNLGAKEEVTAEAKVPAIKVGVVPPGTNCVIDTTKTPLTSEYTTGNTIVTAENTSGGMVKGWWE